MKLFISWSGWQSRKVASALRQWIPDILQTVEPWMSQHDIAAGARWYQDLASNLEETKFGIICLTQENTTSPWLLFETGSLAKTVAGTYVCPYLVDLDPSDVPPGPLTHFQAKRANEDETFELLASINNALSEGALSEEKLKRAFDRWWPDLKMSLDEVPALHLAPEKKRTTEEMVGEILEVVRSLSRNTPPAVSDRFPRVRRLERKFMELASRPDLSRAGKRSTIHEMLEMFERDAEGDEAHAAREIAIRFVNEVGQGPQLFEGVLKDIESEDPDF